MYIYLIFLAAERDSIIMLKKTSINPAVRAIQTSLYKSRIPMSLTFIQKLYFLSRLFAFKIIGLSC